MQGAFSFAAQAIEKESNAAIYRGRGWGVSIKMVVQKVAHGHGLELDGWQKSTFYINGLEKAPD